ncbi:magnesium chelatase [SAR202 cluster bacterium AD-804-J14_MRT_500m]|nr:magnesium chelatase [SAR202 cluster bacterium AD-804-J14_MRT_500m]
MPTAPLPNCLKDLELSGYRTKSVRHELRHNLIQKLRNKDQLFPGIIGYDDTVIPQITNAILASQDLILLGERGQAKTRLIQGLVDFLDPHIPVIKGCEINDDPFDPICAECVSLKSHEGRDLEISWVEPDERYSEKLATPDISIADLIGEVDPIKVAEGRYLSDERTIHYGLVPRTNRGLFCINELPDLAERVQVGLFNLMEERDVQIKGYRVQLPIDIFVVATANPEDYTNRGRIITPLKDRFGAQIRTHYPKDPAEEIMILDQERSQFANESTIFVPPYYKEIISEVTALARVSPHINQRSGVSVRVSISNIETVISNATRRAIQNREKWAIPRISDLPFIISSFAGKIEMDSFEDGQEAKVLDEILGQAVLNVFNRYFNASDLDSILQCFDQDTYIETGSTIRSATYSAILRAFPQLADAVSLIAGDDRPALHASAAEFVLEGLHLNRKLNRRSIDGKFRFERSRPTAVTRHPRRNPRPRR